MKRGRPEFGRNDIWTQTMHVMPTGSSLGGLIGQGGGDVLALPPPEQAISPDFIVTEFWCNLYHKFSEHGSGSTPPAIV
eukprot:3881870-Karenia_brevis.AAC.2